MTMRVFPASAYAVRRVARAATCGDERLPVAANGNDIDIAQRTLQDLIAANVRGIGDAKRQTDGCVRKRIIRERP